MSTGLKGEGLFATELPNVLSKHSEFPSLRLINSTSIPFPGILASPILKDTFSHIITECMQAEKRNKTASLA